MSGMMAPKAQAMMGRGGPARAEQRQPPGGTSTAAEGSLTSTSLGVPLVVCRRRHRRPSSVVVLVVVVVVVLAVVIVVVLVVLVSETCIDNNNNNNHNNNNNESSRTINSRLGEDGRGQDGRRGGHRWSESWCEGGQGSTAARSVKTGPPV